MNDVIKLVLAIVFLVVSIISLILVLVITRKIGDYCGNINQELADKTNDFYYNIELKEDKYFPYFKTHAAGVYHQFKCKDEIDPITKIRAKKNYHLSDDKVVIIVNNNIHYNLEIVNIDGQDYIKIDHKIKTIEVFLSFDKPCHYLYSYQIDRIEKDRFDLTLKDAKKTEPKRKKQKEDIK